VVETVAENTVDGIIAPLFFLLLGGAPLAMAYKAVNTLDSMVGYKHEKYRAIGMVSARLDDVANFLPARLSWLLLSLAAVVCGKMAPGRCGRAGAIAISTAVLTAPGRKRPSPARWDPPWRPERLLRPAR
jgi:adenosylcobinamide-phosphate synthase